MIVNSLKSYWINSVKQMFKSQKSINILIINKFTKLKHNECKYVELVDSIEKFVQILLSLDLLSITILTLT